MPPVRGEGGRLAPRLDRQDSGAADWTGARQGLSPATDEHAQALAAIAALLGSCQIQPFAAVEQRDTRVVGVIVRVTLLCEWWKKSMQCSIRATAKHCRRRTSAMTNLHTGRHLCRLVALPDTKMLCVEIATSTDTEATSAFQELDSADSQDRG